MIPDPFSSAAPVRVQRDGPVSTVAMGSGKHHNAFTATGWHHFGQDISSALVGGSSLAAVLLRGSGGTLRTVSHVAEWIDAAPDTAETSFAPMGTAFPTVEVPPVPAPAESSYTGRPPDAPRALATDLADYTVPEAGLAAHGKHPMADIIRNSPSAVRAAKHNTRRMEMEDGWQFVSFAPAD